LATAPGVRQFLGSERRCGLCDGSTEKYRGSTVLHGRATSLYLVVFVAGLEG
jgi:hypothetical protein